MQRAQVDDEVRSFADDVTADMTPSWVSAVRRAAGSRLDQLGDRLDQALADTDLGVARLPAWVVLVRMLQWLLLLAAVGGLAWTVLLAVRGTLQDSDTVAIGGVALAIVLLVGGLVVGLLLGLLCRLFVARMARTRASRADDRLREGVNEVTHELVIEPVEARARGVRRRARRSGPRPLVRPLPVHRALPDGVVPSRSRTGASLSAPAPSLVPSTRNETRRQRCPTAPSPSAAGSAPT